MLVVKELGTKFNPLYPTKCQRMMASASTLSTDMTGTDRSTGLTDKPGYPPWHGQGQ